MNNMWRDQIKTLLLSINNLIIHTRTTMVNSPQKTIEIRVVFLFELATYIYIYIIKKIKR